MSTKSWFSYTFAIATYAYFVGAIVSEFAFFVSIVLFGIVFMTLRIGFVQNPQWEAPERAFIRKGVLIGIAISAFGSLVFALFEMISVNMDLGVELRALFDLSGLGFFFFFTSLFTMGPCIISGFAVSMFVLSNRNSESQRNKIKAIYAGGGIGVFAGISIVLSTMFLVFRFSDPNSLISGLWLEILVSLILATVLGAFGGRWIFASYQKTIANQPETPLA